MNIQPIGTKVLIKIELPEQKSDSGLYTLAAVGYEMATYGTILAIGEQVNELKVGDKAYFGKYKTWNEVGDGLFVMQQTEFIGVFEE